MKNHDQPAGPPPVKTPSPITPPLRPRELEDGLNYYLYHPLAWRLAMLLAKTPLTPNMVSILGGGCVVAAAYSYSYSDLQAGWPWMALLGMVLHMLWHVVDGADGDLARITGKASPIGEMVDGICDYFSHIVLYLTLGWLMARWLSGGWLVASWVLVVLAGASHIAQANHVEVQRRSYQWWVYSKSWLGLSHGKDNAAARKGVLGALAAAYLGVAAGMDAGAKRLDAAILQLQGDEDGLHKLRNAIRAKMPPLFRLQQILGPNPRALILGLSMVLGSPLWYFLYQTVILNLLLLLSVKRHNAAANEILAE